MHMYIYDYIQLQGYNVFFLTHIFHIKKNIQVYGGYDVIDVTDFKEKKILTMINSFSATSH